MENIDKNKSNNYSSTKLSKYDKLISNVDTNKLTKWKNIQNDLKSKLIEYDNFKLKNNSSEFINIAGVDITVSKFEDTKGIVGISVIRSDNFELIYEDYELVEITEPYVPGFLAFKEVDHLLNLIKNMYNKIENKDILPDAILVDGNGILHSNRFGLASHLGVLIDEYIIKPNNINININSINDNNLDYSNIYKNIPTIGVGKTVFAVDGINKHTVKKLVENNLLKAKDYVYLKGNSKSIWGAALRSTDEAYIPIYVSIGHNISLETSLNVVNKSINYRIPEPIRISDLTTRLLMKYYENIKFKAFDIKKYLSTIQRKYLYNKKIEHI